MNVIAKILLRYKYKTTIDSLSKSQSIFVMKQDKESGVAVMDRSKDTEKCLSVLQTEQFTKLRHDPTSLSKTRYNGNLGNNINNRGISPVISHRLKPG